MEQALRNLVMQGRIDRGLAEAHLQSSSASSAGGLGTTAPSAPASVAAGR
jgi:hypothetical protein